MTSTTDPTASEILVGPAVLAPARVSEVFEVDDVARAEFGISGTAAAWNSGDEMKARTFSWNVPFMNLRRLPRPCWGSSKVDTTVLVKSTFCLVREYSCHSAVIVATPDAPS